jgi:glycosyltransferase involved in cell wall biosynthesis
MKVLFVGNRPSKVTCGGDQVNLRNLSLLESVFGAENIVCFPLDSYAGTFSGPVRLLRKFRTLCQSLRLYAGGLDSSREKALMRTVAEGDFGWVFIPDVQIGRVVPRIKKISPSTQVATFFHNVMRLYAKAYVKSGGVSHLPFYFAACRNETLAVRHSDRLIVLNSRESSLLKKIYGRGADLELPISYADRFDERRVMNAEGMLTLLFVGINFFANAEGIRWFAANVMPRVHARLIVVGSGMDKLSAELSSDTIEVHGFVDDLDAFYYAADIFVLPIFSGGGMKTKTAEGMMFGKTIFGTAESFVGYDLDYAKTGALCETADEYAAAIGNFAANRPARRFNAYTRELFLERFEKSGSLERFSAVFSESTHDVRGNH